MVSDDTFERYTPERFRDFFHRKSLAADRHRAALARLLKLTESEAAALAHLARNGHVTPGQLAEALSLTSGGVTALTHRLERAGHVTRHPHPTDRRSTVLKATPLILERAQECYAPLVRDMDAAAAELTPEEREVVGRFLERIAVISEQHAGELAASARNAEQEQLASAPSPGLWA